MAVVFGLQFNRKSYLGNLIEFYTKINIHFPIQVNVISIIVLDVS